MTAIAAPARIASPHRVVATARVHASNPWAIFYTPWMVLLGVFALNFAIWHIVAIGAGNRPLPPDAFTNNGGVAWIFVYMVVVAVQAMNQTFSFVVGLGSTRRDYFLGTASVFAGLATTFGVGIALLAWVERATNGWGIHGAFFAPGPFGTVPIWELAIINVLTLLLMFFIGTAAGAVFVRWGATGIIVFIGSLAVLLVVAVYLITVNDAWPAVGRFFTEHTPLELSVFTLPVSVAAGLVGFALMRRATPKG